MFQTRTSRHPITVMVPTVPLSPCRLPVDRQADMCAPEWPWVVSRRWAAALTSKNRVNPLQTTTHTRAPSVRSGTMSPAVCPATLPTV